MPKHRACYTGLERRVMRMRRRNLNNSERSQTKLVRNLLGTRRKGRELPGQRRLNEGQSSTLPKIYSHSNRFDLALPPLLNNSSILSYDHSPCPTFRHLTSISLRSTVSIPLHYIVKITSQTHVSTTSSLDCHSFTLQALPHPCIRPATLHPGSSVVT